MKPDKMYQVILMTFFGMLGSIMIGFIFYNTSIFKTTRTDFQFVGVGLYGALYFSFLEYKSVKEQTFAMIFIFLFQLIVFTGKHLSLAYVIRDVFYLGAIFLSIKLYYRFIKKYTVIKFYLRSLALVLIYGLIGTLFISIVYILNTKSGLPPFGFIYVIAKKAVLIGLGIGLGIDFYFQNQKQLFGLLKIKTTKHFIHILFSRQRIQ